MKRIGPKLAVMLASSILAGAAVALFIARPKPEAGRLAAFPIPPAADLKELVERADVIVSAELSATYGAFMFAGYDLNGMPIIFDTPTASPGDAAPQLDFTLPAYDYPINVITTYLDNGVVAAGQGFDYRSVGAPLQMANSVVISDTLLYFIGPNPDGTTYATFGHCEILDLSGSHVLCAQTGDVWGGANGMSPAQFIPALQTEIAVQHPTPTPTPTSTA